MISFVSGTIVTIVLVFSSLVPVKAETTKPSKEDCEKLKRWSDEGATEAEKETHLFWRHFSVLVDFLVLRDDDSERQEIAEKRMACLRMEHELRTAQQMSDSKVETEYMAQIAMKVRRAREAGQTTIALENLIPDRNIASNEQNADVQGHTGGDKGASSVELDQRTVKVEDLEKLIRELIDTETKHLPVEEENKTK